MPQIQYTLVSQPYTPYTQDCSSIEISRKNGIPLYFQLASQAEAASLLSLLCGYYRLAEKSTFSLCTEMSFPRLEAWLADKVHGPVSRGWAEEKLRRKTGFKKGAYLVRQSLEDHRKLHLLYCSHSGCKPEEVTLQEEEEGGYRILAAPPSALARPWPSLAQLLHALKTLPSNIELGDCVHPSEFDRADSLLPCRTDLQRREDSLGAAASLGARERVVIQPRSLSRYETSLKEGRLTQVWQGEWKRRGGAREEVAIRQLRLPASSEDCTRFLELARRCLEWDDPSLASGRGLCLPCDSQPPVLVTEWFPLGTLSSYLSSHTCLLQPVDLLEAATCLARALYYLADQGLAHGQIRARNLMVAQHSDTQFKVKLCEGGLGPSLGSEVHWLDFQQLQEVLGGQEVTASIQGDVWSTGTCLWEIYSRGASPLPGVGEVEAASQYLGGHRLPCPPGAGQLYQVMLDCWAPHPQARKRPQAVMRDINQMLYKVYNSRRVHDYVTIGETSVSTPATLTPDRRSLSSSPGSSGQLAPPSGSLVPIFTDTSRRLLAQCRGAGEFGSSSPLLGHGSRSGSSLAGSLFNTDMSALTYQTSLDMDSSIAGGLYSISSIYQIGEDQIEYSTEYPLGEGNFGVVYKGVRTKTDGDWEQVAIKKVKDTDTMPSSAVDDMEREVNLMKKLSHENIVKIRGVLQDGPNVIIVMEYIREGSLDRSLPPSSSHYFEYSIL